MMDFLTIDFETAAYSRASACSVGIVKFKNGKPADTYYSLIRPPRLYIRPDFTDIHGLTVNDVKNAPRFNDIWDSEIKPFLSGETLAAHNASFDMTVLKSVLNYYDLPIPELPYFCTCNLARRTWSGQKSFALSALAEKFGIIYKAHNALDDALTCGRLVQMSAEKFEFDNNSSLDELLKAAKIKIKNL